MQRAHIVVARFLLGDTIKYFASENADPASLEPGQLVFEVHAQIETPADKRFLRRRARREARRRGIPFVKYLDPESR